MKTNHASRITHHASRIMSQSIKLACLLSLIGLLSWHNQPADASPPAQAPTQKPDLANGAAIWLESCLPCHGPVGAGDGPTSAQLEFPPANFADPLLARERTLAGMFEVALNGRIERLMPPWNASLSEQEIWDVVAYAYSLSISPDDLAAGETVYAESCAACHGEDGVAPEIDLSQPATLANTNRQTLFDLLRAGEGVHADMAALSDDALWQSLAYAGSLSVDAPSLDGVVRGQIRNGTSGEILADIPVTLYAVTANGQLMQTYTAFSDFDGTFIFTDLSTDHTLSYVVEGIYGGVSYAGDEMLSFVPDMLPELASDVTVYESTDQNDLVSQTRLHRILAFGPGVISLADIYVFENAGDRAFVGQVGQDGLPATVKIGVPESAFDVSFQDGMARQEDGYYISGRPIPPGEETMISVTYNVLLDGSDYRLETPLYYDVQAVNVLAADQGQTIEINSLVFQGTESFQGNTYQLFVGSDLKADQNLVINLSDLPEFEVPTGSGNRVADEQANQPQTVVLWSILGLGGLALIFGLVYADRNQAIAAGSDSLSEEKTRLLVLLAELEALHQAGEIDAEAHRRLRFQYRDRLKQILIQLQETAL